MMTALQSQYLSIRNTGLATVHQWLCHPGQDCQDGCDVTALPGRLAAMDAVEDAIDLARQDD